MSLHVVKVRCVRANPFACQVELDGVPVRGLQHVSFAIDNKDRQPLVTLTLKAHELDAELELPDLPTIVPSGGA